MCSTFERRQRNGFSMLKLQEEKRESEKNISFFEKRREILNHVPLFREEKEKPRVHNFREEKEKFSFSDIKYPPKPHYITVSTKPQTLKLHISLQKYEAFLTGRERETVNRVS